MSNLTIATSPALPAKQDAASLVKAFLSGKSERTIEAYGQDLATFADFVGAATLEEAAKLLLYTSHGQANSLGLAYRATLLERGLSPATVNRRLASLRSLVTLARTLGLTTWTLEVKNVKSTPYRDTRGPGVPAFKRMLNQLNRRKDSKGIRDTAILRLLYDLALRRGEVAALDVDDVDLEAGVVAVLGKGHRERISLTLPEPTTEALRKWLEVRGVEPGPLFTNVDRAGKGRRLTGRSIHRLVQKLGNRIGAKVRPHGLRHTSITEACKAAQANGINLEEVLDFSRHSRSSISVLLVYRDRERNVQGQLASLVADSV